MPGCVQHQLAARYGASPTAALAPRLTSRRNSVRMRSISRRWEERLLDVVVGAHPQAHQLIHLVVLRREEDHRQVTGTTQLLQQFHSVHARHLDVEHGEIDRLGGEGPQRLGASV